MPNRRRVINSGDSFNSLTFVNEINARVGSTRVGLFRCDCGNEGIFNISRVVYGRIKRCRDCRNNANAEAKRKYAVNNIFKEWSDKDASYILGLYFSDGNVRQNRRIAEISLSEVDKDILLKIRDKVQPSKPLYYCNVSNGRNQYKLAIASKEIVSRFIDAGCVPNKSLILKYPKVNINNRHFIRGYLDGDGHISRSSVSMIGAKSLLMEMHNVICTELNRDIPVRFYHKKGTNENVLTMNIRFFPDRKMVLDWIYGDDGISMNRKKTKYVYDYIFR